MAFYEGVDPEVAAPFNFEGIGLPWEAHAWHRFLRSFHMALSDESSRCVASYAFGNHDQPRLASRIGREAARSAAVMLLTLPGMAFVYYGEELGMEDVAIPADRVQDPAAKGDPLKGQGRDPARTPMQWTPGPQAGFTEGPSTWLPLAADYGTRNVETQSNDPQSSLSLYRTLGKLRNGSAGLKYGTIEILDLPATNVLAYKRTYEGEELLVLVNFSDEPVVIDPVSFKLCQVSSSPQRVISDEDGSLADLYPHEAIVLSP
jgi:alpha-glucosidase